MSCAACHGTGKSWIRRHYRSGWKELSPDEKASQGYRNLDDLSIQAKICSSCHVGQDGAEVNHDLIAAGHPAMRFDFVWYRNRMPQHWNPERSTSPPSDAVDSLRGWLLGQFATAGASLQQLERRARAVVEDRPGHVWPELSEGGCFACHHDLGGDGSWRQARALTTAAGADNRLPQILVPWRPWELELLPRLAAHLENDQSAEFQRTHAHLKRLMDAALAPDAGEVARLVGETSAALEQWIAVKDSITNDNVAEALKALIAESESDACVTSWEQAAQLFLALAAPHRGGRTPIPPALMRLRDVLQFSNTANARFDSPRQFQGSAAGSAARTSVRGEALQHIRELGNQLK